MTSPHPRSPEMMAARALRAGMIATMITLAAGLTLAMMGTAYGSHILQAGILMTMGVPAVGAAAAGWGYASSGNTRMAAAAGAVLLLLAAAVVLAMGIP